MLSQIHMESVSLAAIKFRHVPHTLIIWIDFYFCKESIHSLDPFFLYELKYLYLHIIGINRLTYVDIKSITSSHLSLTLSVIAFIE